MFMITRVQAKLELFKLSTSDIINDRITFIQSKVYFLDGLIGLSIGIVQRNTMDNARERRIYSNL